MTRTFFSNTSSDFCGAAGLRTYSVRFRWVHSHGPKDGTAPRLLCPETTKSPTPSFGTDSQIHVSAYGLARMMKGRMNSQTSGLNTAEYTPTNRAERARRRNEEQPPATVLQHQVAVSGGDQRFRPSRGPAKPVRCLPSPEPKRSPRRSNIRNIKPWPSCRRWPSRGPNRSMV